MKTRFLQDGAAAIPKAAGCSVEAKGVNRNMSLDAIKTVGQAEENARRIRQDAIAAAKRAIAEAEAAGEESIKAAEKRAEEELRELRRKSDEKATEDAGELARSTENKKAALRVKAEAKLDSAAMLVVERIVNS